MTSTGQYTKKYEATQAAVLAVAAFWLKSTDEILASGRRAASFTGEIDGKPYGLKLAMEEIDNPRYNRLRRFMDTSLIFLLAKQEILTRLKIGQYPAITAFFTVTTKA